MNSAVISWPLKNHKVKSLKEYAAYVINEDNTGLYDRYKNMDEMQLEQFLPEDIVSSLPFTFACYDEHGPKWGRNTQCLTIRPTKMRYRGKGVWDRISYNIQGSV